VVADVVLQVGGTEELAYAMDTRSVWGHCAAPGMVDSKVGEHSCVPEALRMIVQDRIVPEIVSQNKEFEERNHMQNELGAAVVHSSL
jgi:hypothetical protein